MDEPSAGAFDGREHRLAVRVYYEDTDFTGVVYHASYVRFFERGRTDALRVVGIGHAELLARPDPCAFTVTRLGIDFLSAARIDDALTIHTWFETVAGPRLFIRQQVTRAGALVARAEVDAACIRPDGRARRPPAELAECLRPYLATATPS
ncbi:MAG TPA: YbgC/FadM family acyl-CoA thioesterase [Caulobacteraceae bacterium]